MGAHVPPDMSQLNDFAESVSIVVSSCDRFFDAWRPFAFFFRKFWPDCPFPVYLIANRLRIRSRAMEAIQTGADRGWASNMQLALERIRTPYILYLQEDYFLTGPVRTEQLASDFSYAMKTDAASFCFCGLALLEPEAARADAEFGAIPTTSKGRTRCQVTLWQRDALAAALRPGETAWDMEARGSERTRDMTMLTYFRNDNVPVPYLISAIVRGLWTTEAIDLCRAHNFRLNPAFRLTDTTTLRGRKFRRAVGRLTFAAAYARQLLTPVDLDAAD
jgi:hypothetical protein